MKQDEDKVIT